MSLQAFNDAAPRQNKPRSLFQFLTWLGGLKPHPDLHALLDGKHGWMLRKAGLSLDDARVACIEEGFLIDNEERADEPSINDLLELIAAEAKGHKQYRVHEALDAMPKQKTIEPESNAMDAAEYKRARQMLGLSNYKMAPTLGISLRQAQRYEGGEQAIPETVAKLIRMYLKHGIDA